MQWRSAAPIGERVKRFLIKPDQRRFQQRGKVQIIIGQQQPFCQCQHILHGQLLSQAHAVNAAHWDGKVLQFPHQCRGKTAALARAQQHQNIAWANAPSIGLRRFLALFHARGQGFMRHHMRDALRQGCRKRGRGPFGTHGLFRWRPIRRRVGLCGLQHRPKLNPAGMACAIRLVLKLSRDGDAIACRRIGENRIHQCKYGFGGPEGNIQADGAEFLPGFLDDFLITVSLTAEAFRIGTLEGVDGLLLIANGEDAAFSPTRTKAGEEFARQRAHNIPLFRVRILRFI